MKLKLIFLILIVGLVGCNTGTSPLGIELKSAEAKEVLAKAPISFLSWNGLWQGIDINTELSFLPDGRVQITHYGSGVDRVTGTYKTDEDTITIDAPWKDLKELRGKNGFPILKLRRDADSYYLFPAVETDMLKYNRKTAWPFKQTHAEHN